MFSSRTTKLWEKKKKTTPQGGAGGAPKARQGPGSIHWLWHRRWCWSCMWPDRPCSSPGWIQMVTLGSCCPARAPESLTGQKRRLFIRVPASDSERDSVKMSQMRPHPKKDEKHKCLKLRTQLYLFSISPLSYQLSIRSSHGHFGEIPKSFATPPRLSSSSHLGICSP